MAIDSMKFRNHNREWQKKYDATAPKAGDMAPDFQLELAGGGRSISLSSFRGHKPVALNFGSYT